MAAKVRYTTGAITYHRMDARKAGGVDQIIVRDVVRTRTVDYMLNGFGCNLAKTTAESKIKAWRLRPCICSILIAKTGMSLRTVNPPSAAISTSAATVGRLA